MECITSGSVDKILDFFDERFDGKTRLFKFFFVGVQILPKVGTVCKTFRELQRQQPHSEQVTPDSLFNETNTTPVASIPFLSAWILQSVNRFSVRKISDSFSRYDLEGIQL